MFTMQASTMRKWQDANKHARECRIVRLVYYSKYGWEFKMADEIIEKLKLIFGRTGIYIENDDMDIALELDSFQFVNILINIEEEFLISLFDSDYLFERLQTFRDFYEMVMTYLN